MRCFFTADASSIGISGVTDTAEHEDTSENWSSSLGLLREDDDDKAFASSDNEEEEVDEVASPTSGSAGPSGGMVLVGGGEGSTVGDS